MADAPVQGADDDRLWRAEWWERCVDAWQRRRDAHRLVGDLARIGLFVALAVVLLAAGASPAVRAGLGAWLGAVWIALVGFAVLRTKTLSWAGFWSLFTVALLWSVVASMLLGAVASSVTSAGPEAPGPAVAVASLGEEALKLAPLLVLAVVAPARVHRFSVADWTLAGLACGAAFTAVEEAVRRVGEVGLDGGGLPRSFNTFGLLGMHLGYDGAAAYPGHHAATGLTAAAIGLGVALVRRGGRDVGARRGVLVAGGVLLPVVVWWTFVVRHAALNALALDVDLPTPMRLTEDVLPAGWGRTGTVLLVVLVVMLVDARRLARWRDASLEDAAVPAWLDTLLDVGERLRASGGPARAVAPVVESGGHLAHVVARDLRQQAEAAVGPTGASSSHGSRWTNRWSGLRDSRTLVAMQREMRQIVQHLDGAPGRPALVRGVAALALVALVVVTFVVAPSVAGGVQSAVQGGEAWMAGLLERLTAWWDAATTWNRLAFSGGAVGAVALSTGAMGRPATSWLDATPVGTAAAAGHAVVGAGLRTAGLVGGAASPWRLSAQEYTSDPRGWRAEQLARLSLG